MADFFNYKGFKIEKCSSGYFSACGKSVFYPVDTMYWSSKSLAAVKKCINTWLDVNKIKKWRTMFPDFIAKETLTY